MRIKATAKDLPVNNAAQKAREVLENILERFGGEATVETEEDSESITLNIKGDGSGILIGRK